MAINYVKGQILSSVLERDGIDIAIANANVGIGTVSPAYALDVVGSANVTDTVYVGNVSTTVANGNITITPAGTGFVTINTTTGLVLPVGNTAQQPSPAPAGTIRYNTTTSLPEFYNGIYWSAFNAGVTNQILNGNGVATTFTLNTATTTAGVLVMLNGIVQIPGQAYNMSPNPSTNLVFTEAPSTSDTIDVRFL
jgi:hypothetical protein